MKRIVFLILPAFIFLVNGCKNDSSGNAADPYGGGGGGTGGVTFQVSVVNQGGQNYFRFTPSASVTVTQIVGTPQGGQAQTVPGDGTTVFTAQDPPHVGPVAANGLVTGTQWAFVITGKVGNAQGQAYTANASYVAP